jgi:hypothetical protein
MKHWLGCGVLLLGFVLSGCAATGGGYYGGRGGGGWELLGQGEADFKKDRDRINVGRREGNFRELRVVVRGAPVEIYDMVVTFADGRTFSPNMRHRFEENSSTREIDLPGDRRAIRYVDFAYRSPNRREGRATVMLYGR